MHARIGPSKCKSVGGWRRSGNSWSVGLKRLDYRKPAGLADAELILSLATTVDNLSECRVFGLDCEAGRGLPALVPFPHDCIGALDVTGKAPRVEQG